MAAMGNSTLDRMTLISGAATVFIVAGYCGWVREARQYRVAPPVTNALDRLRLMPNRISGTPPEIYFAMGKPYESSALDLSQGKRLYSWFGCSECHSDGSGGRGPAFLDGWWLYGPSMVSIVASIRDGRPQGMPPFKDKMTIDEIWQLAGYVRSIGAYQSSIAAPGRSDEKISRPAENRAPASLMFDPGPRPLHIDQGPTP